MLDYLILDVFTEVPLKGNPLAVVLGADGLPKELMLSLAQEFNLSETVFLMASDDPACAARTRIFTPKSELPFAGYPLIGAAVAVARGNPEVGGSFSLLTEIGPVPCTVRLGEKADFAEITAPRAPAPAEGSPSAASVAAALGLGTSDIGYGRHVPSRHEAGNPFFFVPVSTLAAMERARPDMGRWEAAFGAGPLAKAFVYCPETVEPESDYHARMFSPYGGAPEDPATGSAAAAFPGVLCGFDGLADGEYSLRLEQGFEMGRNSIIGLGFAVKGGKSGPARVGGSVIAAAKGQLLIGRP